MLREAGCCYHERAAFLGERGGFPLPTAIPKIRLKRRAFLRRAFRDKDPMTSPVILPLWLFVLILCFAAITFASHFLFPSVRWFLRRRMERAVDQLNRRLERPIEPFKLLRRYDLIQRLVYDPQVTEAIVEHAERNHVREDVAFERARKYAREIVPSFSAFTYFGWGVRLARFLSKSLYRVRLGYHDEEALSQLDAEATIVFVMNHRSNMDYVLVTHLAADRSALSYAVGEWAQVWPLSRLIRAMGAYFIRRRSNGGLYRKVLRRYVQMATKGGVTQAIFPEGGLSLDGSVKRPKVGLLSYITEDLDLAEQNVVFVPVALNYDRVLEDQVLTAAAKAGTRRFNAKITHVSLATLKLIWLKLIGRYHRFGYAAVSFGKPVSLRDMPEMLEAPEELAEMLMRRIAEIIPVLPVPLVSHLLLEQSLSEANLQARFNAAQSELQHAHIHLPHQDLTYAMQYGLERLTKRGLVESQSGVLKITEDGRALVEYYANSIKHLFPDKPQ